MLKRTIQDNTLHGFQVFSAHIVEDLDMVSMTFQDLGAKEEWPAVLALELGDVSLALTPRAGDWALVEQETDVIATFAVTPVETSEE